MRPAIPVLLALAVLVAAERGAAQVVLSAAPDVATPDGGGALGVQSTLDLTTSLRVTTDVNVRLVIGPASGDSALNGDFYAYLSHAGQIAVLVNRVGRTASDSVGSLDNGFDVVLDDQSATDIHVHTPVVQPDYPATQLPLTGTWRPDGWNVLPTLVTDASARTATLSAFNGTDPNGEWTLFVSDFGSGAAGRLVRWELTVAAAVPEAPSWAWGLGAATLLLGTRRRFRR